MKIYRYPSTNKVLKEKTDEIELGQETNLSNLDFDITIDKAGERHSRVQLVVEEGDFKELILGILRQYQEKIKFQERRIDELKNNLIVHQKYWNEIELMFEPDERYDINRIMEISRNMAIGYSDGIKPQKHQNNSTGKSILQKLLRLDVQDTASQCWRLIQSITATLSDEDLIQLMEYSVDTNATSQIKMAICDDLRNVIDDSSKIKTVLSQSVPFEKKSFTPLELLKIITAYLNSDEHNSNRI